MKTLKKTRNSWVFGLILMFFILSQPVDAFNFENTYVPDAERGLIINVYQDGTWQQAGVIQFGKWIESKTLDLGQYIENSDYAKIMIIKRGGGLAHLDAVSLGDKLPITAYNCSNDWGVKLNAIDNDLMDLTDGGIFFEYEAASNTLLNIAARVEPTIISKYPFIFPEKGSFYTYSLTAEKSTINPDISNAFFSKYCITGSGHPSGYTYGWVSNDDEYLYAMIDFTPDNTMDGELDYAAIKVNTGNGIKEFKITANDNSWGTTEFIYNDNIGYQHKIYHFSIPLNEFKNTGSDLQLAFFAYGTASSCFPEIIEPIYGITSSSFCASVEFDCYPPNPFCDPMEKGLIWSDDPFFNYQNYQGKISISTDNLEEFDICATGLEAATTYYVKAFYRFDCQDPSDYDQIFTSTDNYIVTTLDGAATAIPMASWAIVIGIVLIGIYTIIYIRRR